MENTDINNVMGLSAVEFDDGESVSADKTKRAYEFYETGRYSEALSLAEADSQISSSSFGQVLIGNCYRSLNDKDKAIAHWKKAVEISPLEYTAYINIGNELYMFILPKIEHYLFDSLKMIELENQLSAISHDVKSSDIANEIYHLIFGEVNEILVDRGMVARPNYIKGEGRYFKSFKKR